MRGYESIPTEQTGKLGSWQMKEGECIWSTYRLSRVTLIVLRKARPTWEVFSGDSASTLVGKEVSHLVDST